MATLLKPRFGQDVPNGANFLNPRRGDSSAADPIFDAWDVEYDLPLKGDSMARRPEADMLYEAALEVLAVGGDDDPPLLYAFYQ